LSLSSVFSALPTGLRRRLKGPAAALLQTALRARRGRIGVVLAYHAVRPREPSGLEVVPSIGRERLRDHLRHLRRHYRVVPLPKLVSVAADRQRGEPYPVALSFDDDLEEHLDHAVPVLAAEGLPATFFLCGRDLLGDGEFWWETLQRAADAGARLPELRQATGGPPAEPGAHDLRAIAADLEALPADELSAAEARLGALAGPRGVERKLGEAEIAELASEGHTVGFHTRRHRVLTGLDERGLAKALDEGREELSRATGAPVEMIAYPHGKADERVADAARDAGFAIGLALGGTAVTPREDPLLLERLPADELSVAELAAAIAAAIARAPSG
jgi:peptidoglycan/xylan/chitin deacetylase (PgdA/CDA1 family)